MATPVSWSYGPWRTQNQPTANPYQDVQYPRRPSYTPPFPFGQEEGGGFGAPGTGVTGPDVSGPMTSDERSTYGMVSDPIGYGFNAAMDATGLKSQAQDAFGTTIGGMVAGAPGAAARRAVSSAVPGYGLATAALKTPGLLESFMQMLGIQPAQRNIMGPTPSEMQGLADKFGYGMPTPFGMSAPEGLVGGVSVGPSGWGTTGPSETAAPSVGNPDSPFGGIGGPSGTDDGTSTGVGQGSGGDGSTGGNTGNDGGGVGNAGDGPGGARRRGGVDVIRRPTTLQFGETTDAQPETVVSIPRSMFRRGRQQNEPEVMLAMKRLLRELRG